MDIAKGSPHFTNTVPTFLLKLINLLQEPDYKEYVSWNEDGTAFTVHDQGNFAKHVLPVYFKHNKFASFVRQLNMYGFRKVSTVMHGGIASLHDTAIQFHHPLFIRGEESLLPYIKRKVNQGGGKLFTEEISQVLDNVQDIKDTQNGISNTLSSLKRENEDLWREVVSLRQKHSHQQKVVNRLIQFLVSLVQHHGMGMKRRMPLMIDDASESSQPNKLARTDDGNSVNLNSTAVAGNPNIMFRTNENTPDEDGPLITELLTQKPEPGDVLSDVNDSNMLNATDNDDFDISELIQVNSPLNRPADSEKQTPSTTSVNETTSDSAANYFTTIPTNEESGLSYLMGTSNTPNATKEENKTAPTPLNKENNQQVAIPVKFPTSLSSKSLLDNSAIPDPDHLNSSMDMIQNNLKDIQRRLSNNEQVELDYDIIQELFNNSVDITPNPANLFEPSPDLITPETENNNKSALVQYNNGTPGVADSNPDTIQFSAETIGDILDMLKE
uniref:Ci-HSF protein n=1 Tax=Ciona intestinalis TaxID=7719 RepID=Q4H3C4_CIOIN|nr:HSF protein [Ciona intestinalis]BAE06503.1 Ci-HSF [Ciona intestinalis]|eukprot:NP_001071737.1 HSF protein [Ciona intestinalis]